jgi:hypothetical protein
MPGFDQTPFPHKKVMSEGRNLRPRAWPKEELASDSCR